MERFTRTGTAVVIEPRADLAGAVCDLLRGFGYQTISAPTHADAAARAKSAASIELLVATVPAPDESRSKVYLKGAVERNARMAIVLMLSDHLEKPEGEPGQAAKIVKPFGRDELASSIRRSEEKALELVSYAEKRN